MPSGSHRDIIPTKTLVRDHWGANVLGRQLTKSLALVLFGCALVGAICRGAEVEDRRLGAANDLLQLAQTRSREPEAKKEAPRIDAARRQALLKHRVEQLRKAGKHDAAASTAQRSLALAEQRHGEHPSVATALTTLGGLYARLHRFPEAEQAYKRALDIREKSLGPDHPDTVTSLNDLAGLYQTQGKHDLAERYYKRALAAEEKSLANNQRPEHCSRRGGHTTSRPSINLKAAPQRRRNSPSKHTSFARRNLRRQMRSAMQVRRRRSAARGESCRPRNPSADNPRRATSQMRRRNRT